MIWLNTIIMFLSFFLSIPHAGISFHTPCISFCEWTFSPFFKLVKLLNQREEMRQTKQQQWIIKMKASQEKEWCKYVYAVWKTEIIAKDLTVLNLLRVYSNTLTAQRAESVVTKRVREMQQSKHNNNNNKNNKPCSMCRLSAVWRIVHINTFEYIACHYIR